MAAKSVVLNGIGTIMINSINVKEKDYETVDPTGKPVIKKMVGKRATSVYINEDGVEIPSSQICKKITVEDEDIIAPKFRPTKEIDSEDITVLEDPSIIYSALSRKFYNVVTDSDKLKDLILNRGKSIEFPFCAGLGWKLWKGVLTNWNNKMLLVCCRGDMTKELEKYSEDTVELEIEVIPQQKNMKKLVKAMAFI